MFCPYCGTKLPDGSRFCGSCGAKLSAPAAPQIDAEPVPVPAEQPAPSIEQTAPVAAQTVPDAPQAPFTAPDAQTAPEKNTGKKKNPVVLITAIVLAAALVLGGGVYLAVTLIAGANAAGNRYVYLSDGSYNLVTNLEKGKSFEFASVRTDYPSSSMLSFSPDGQYVYYYSKYDYTGNMGTLCRAEYGKLKNNSDKNDDYITIIAPNATIGFQILEDGSVLYMSSEFTLYRFDGSESTQLAKKVNTYYLEGADTIVYQAQNSNDGCDLFQMSVSDPGSKEKLLSDIYYIVTAVDLHNIVVAKQSQAYNPHSGYSLDLYVTGIDHPAEMIAEDAQFKAHGQDAFYYSVTDYDHPILPYQFVDDSMAASDALLVEPNLEDYGTPRYKYNTISGNSVKENDYVELYTSCTNKLYWLGSGWNTYSMEGALKVNWKEKNDEIHAALTAFIEKYKSQENEAGYILVTPQVKEDLMKINELRSNPTPENENRWLWLCTEKVQSGTNYDYDAYYAAQDIYWGKNNRDWMREQLKSEDHAFYTSSVYCYTDGKANLVAENVLNVSGYDCCVEMNILTDDVTPIPIEDISYAHYVESTVRQEMAERVQFASGKSGILCSVSEDAQSFMDDINANSYFALRGTNNALYLTTYEGLLARADISGGTVGKFTVIADDVYICDTDEDTIFYFTGTSSSKPCDLYRYEKGTTEKIAEDVLSSMVAVYRDGSILARTDSSPLGYEVTIIGKDGTRTILDEDISQCIRLDASHYLYISQGDLYCFDGEKRTMVAPDVDAVWAKDFERAENIYSYYYYG